MTEKKTHVYALSIVPDLTLGLLLLLLSATVRLPWPDKHLPSVCAFVSRTMCVCAFLAFMLHKTHHIPAAQRTLCRAAAATDVPSSEPHTNAIIMRTQSSSSTPSPSPAFERYEFRASLCLCVSVSFSLCLVLSAIIILCCSDQPLAAPMIRCTELFGAVFAFTTTLRACKVSALCSAHKCARTSRNKGGPEPTHHTTQHERMPRKTRSSSDAKCGNTATVCFVFVALAFRDRSCQRFANENCNVAILLAGCVAARKVRCSVSWSHIFCVVALRSL